MPSIWVYIAVFTEPYIPGMVHFKHHIITDPKDTEDVYDQGRKIFSLQAGKIPGDFVNDYVVKVI